MAWEAYGGVSAPEYAYSPEDENPRFSFQGSSRKWSEAIDTEKRRRAEEKVAYTPPSIGVYRKGKGAGNVVFTGYANYGKDYSGFLLWEKDRDEHQPYAQGAEQLHNEPESMYGEDDQVGAQEAAFDHQTTAADEGRMSKASPLATPLLLVAAALLVGVVIV